MISFYFLMLQAAAPESSVPAAAVVPSEPVADVGLPAAQESAVASPAATVLPRDTPVELMATAEVTTAKAKPGTVFKLRVNRAVEVGGRIVVPVGTPAFGEVITATDSGGLGKSGRMSARLLHIQFGEARIPLEGEVQAKGTGAGSAGVAFAVTLSPLALFHRGNNAKIKAGELLAGFVSKDVSLDLSGTVPRLAQEVATATPAAP